MKIFPLTMTAPGILPEVLTPWGRGPVALHPGKEIPGRSQNVTVRDESKKFFSDDGFK